MVNQHNGLIAAELSRLVDLPRATVLRLLATLSYAGYVTRSESDGRYRATRRLRELSCGYEEENWLRNIVQPFLAELEEHLAWPLAVVRLEETSLLVEATTDQHSHMLLRRNSPGIELSLLATSCGYLYMALLPPAGGRALTAHAIADSGETLRRIGMSATDVLDRVEATRRAGYATLHLSSHSALTMPVWVDGELFCGLNMRIYGSIEARRIILDDYVEDLRDAARLLGERISQPSSIPRVLLSAIKGTAPGIQ
jgi:IclR family mhp operon transcriptional activator